MAKQLSTHAAAAKMIRQHLKSIGVPGKVTSSSYSGGNSVNVNVGDPLAVDPVVVFVV